MKWDTEKKDAPAAAGPQPIVAHTTAVFKHGKKEDPPQVKDETVGSAQVAGKPAVVGFGAGLTLSLGHFEMARLDVRLEYPCEATPQGVAAAYEFAKEWVTQRLQAEVDEVRRGPNK